MKSIWILLNWNAGEQQKSIYSGTAFRRFPDQERSGGIRLWIYCLSSFSIKSECKWSLNKKLYIQEMSCMYPSYCNVRASSASDFHRLELRNHCRFRQNSFVLNLLWKSEKQEKLYIQEMSCMYPSHRSNVWV